MPKIDRRAFMGATALASGVVAVGGRAHAAADAVLDLRVSQTPVPLGVEDAAPTLSWRMQSTRRNASQAAYRVIVAASREACASGAGDIWDSGRVASGACTGIAYGGPALRSRQRCFWTVEVWDETGGYHRAQVAWWEMGLLQPSDWTARWLAVESELEKDDREFGMGFFGVENRTQGVLRRFRLDFVMAEAGVCMLTMGVQGRLGSVAIDGAIQEPPFHPPSSWGPPPAGRWSLDLPAGAHTVSVDLRGSYEPGVDHITIRSQLRLTYSNRQVERIKTGWRVSLEDTSNWRVLDSAARDWPLAAETPPETEDWPPAPARYLRRVFTVSKPVASARLYVSALGGYEAHLNGELVGDDKLASESTDFGKRVLYRVHDVGAQLRVGENVVGALVGDGWYASYNAPTGRYPYGPAPRRFIAQLEITYVDGAQETIVTDKSWRAHASPVLSSEIYNGEYYDARRELPGWDGRRFDGSGWDRTWMAQTPPCKLVCLISAPIRAAQELAPKSVSEPAPGKFVFDMGQNFAGWTRLRARVPAGAQIIMRFAEYLKHDGAVDQANLRGARATDTYVARGDARGEVFEPHFTYHGFRYVQVEGLSAAPGRNALTGIVAHTDLPETAMLETGSPLITQLWLNGLWSQRSNFFGIPTDCPQRDERLGWMGDARVFWDTAAYNMDVYAFTRRFGNDVRDAQRADSGGFPIFAPSSERNAGATGPTPGWSDAGVQLPWTAAMRYGDPAIINDNWDAMERYLGGILEGNSDYIWRNARGNDFADWLSLDGRAPGDATTLKDLIGTAMLVQGFDQMVDMARWSGREAAVATYQRHAEAGRAAFMRQYVDADGKVGNGSQTSYILAIVLKLVPDSMQLQVGRSLVADIRRRGSLISTGFIGTPISLDAVADAGDTNLVFDLLLRTQYPSWGYMIDHGATTIWERWNGDTGDMAMNSFNHYALGGVCGFIFRRVVGIDAASPGFARLRMRPLVDARVGQARATYDSVRGRIAAGWRVDRQQLSYQVTLPANVAAEIELPAPDGAALREGGRRLVAGQSALREHANGKARIEVGAGSYTFTLG